MRYNHEEPQQLLPPPHDPFSVQVLIATLAVTSHAAAPVQMKILTDSKSSYVLVDMGAAAVAALIEAGGSWEGLTGETGSWTDALVVSIEDAEHKMAMSTMLAEAAEELDSVAEAALDGTVWFFQGDAASRRDV